jgi:hypothetical protein
MIVNVIGPYREPGRNDAFLALHDLDIIDKHRSILPVVGFASASEIEIVEVVHGERTSVAYAQAISELTFTSVCGISEIEIGPDASFSLNVLFNEGHFKGKPVIKTLRDLSQLVSGIVETFEKACV